jgi:hypothetical protein
MKRTRLLQRLQQHGREIIWIKRGSERIEGFDRSRETPTSLTRFRSSFLAMVSAIARTCVIRV